MNDYEETYRRIQDLKHQFDSYRGALLVESLRLRARFSDARFSDAGWGEETVFDVGQVHVRDLNGDVQKWRLTNLRDLEDCLKALEAAEKAAEAAKEVK